MTLHQTIKEQIKDALRAKDSIRLDTLRGLNAQFQNEIMSGKTTDEYLSDDKVLAIIKRGVKQRKDSIEQFTKGNRDDLVAKEKAELTILASFLPAMMSYNEIKIVARTRIEAIKAQGGLDSKATGKIMGILVKEFAGKADGSLIKQAVDEILAAK